MVCVLSSGSPEKITDARLCHRILSHTTDIWAFSDAGGEWTHLVDQCEKISASEGESIVNDGFEVKESVGKGLGAFATRTFQRGDMILAEKPLFTIGSQMRFVIKSTVAGLSESQKEAFMSLSPGAASRYDDPVVDRYCTNAFKTETRDVEALESIFLTASRFNHGCMRNARYGWNEGSGQLRIYALRDIAVGEEIEVSFLGPPERHRAVQSERQAILEKNWGFVCACAVCMLPSAEREKSDRRRSEIARMRGGLQSLTGPFQGERFMKEVMDIIRVMKKEGYTGEIADLTKEMVARCAVHSDWQSVEYWVRKTYQIIFEEWGADHRSAKAVLAPAEWRRNPPAVYHHQTFTTRL